MASRMEHVVHWLRDAYAMEKHAEAMLSAQASRLEHYPDVLVRIEKHLHATIGQQRLLEGCLTRLGASPSLIKGMAGEIAAFGEAIAGVIRTDEVVKGVVGGYVFENTQIAAYTALIEAANGAGDLETAKVCKHILVQEIEMGRWLLANLPDIVNAYLCRSADGREKASG